MSISILNLPASMLGVPLLVSGALVVGSCVQNSSSHTPLAPVRVQSAEQLVPGEVLVQFREGTSSARIGDILAATGATIDKHLGTPLVILVRPSDGCSTDELIVRLREYREVLYAEPNRIRRIEPPPALPGAKPNPPSP